MQIIIAHLPNNCSFISDFPPNLRLEGSVELTMLDENVNGVVLELKLKRGAASCPPDGPGFSTAGEVIVGVGGGWGCVLGVNETWNVKPVSFLSKTAGPLVANFPETLTSETSEAAKLSEENAGFFVVKESNAPTLWSFASIFSFSEAEGPKISLPV